MILAAPGCLRAEDEGVARPAPPADADRIDTRDRGPLTRVDRGVLAGVGWLPDSQEGIQVLNDHERGTDAEAARLRDGLRQLQTDRRATDAGRWILNWPLILATGAAAWLGATVWAAVKGGLVAPLLTTAWRSAIPGLAQAGRLGAGAGLIGLGAAVAGSLAVHAWRERRHSLREAEAVVRFQQDVAGERAAIAARGGAAPLVRADGTVVRAIRWLPGTVEKIDTLNFQERATPAEAATLHAELDHLEHWNGRARPAPLAAKWPLIVTMAGLGIFEGLVKGTLGPVAGAAGGAGLARVARAVAVHGLVGAGVGIGLIAVHRLYMELAGVAVQHVTVQGYRERTRELFAVMRERPLEAAPEARPEPAPEAGPVEIEAGLARADGSGMY